MSNPNPERDERVRQIRERQPDSKVQCADCFAWIDRDVNHTCQRQIKRNRKHGKR